MWVLDSYNAKARTDKCLWNAKEIWTAQLFYVVKPLKKPNVSKKWQRHCISHPLFYSLNLCPRNYYLFEVQTIVYWFIRRGTSVQTPDQTSSTKRIIRKYISKAKTSQQDSLHENSTQTKALIMLIFERKHWTKCQTLVY